MKKAIGLCQRTQLMGIRVPRGRRVHKFRALVWWVMRLNWVIAIPRVYVVIPVPALLCSALRYRASHNRRNICSRILGNRGGAGRRSFTGALWMLFNNLAEHKVGLIDSLSYELGGDGPFKVLKKVVWFWLQFQGF